MQERLQKIIARSGKASRRKAEELILQGRVKVNGRVVTELGSKADPSEDAVKVDGKLLHGGSPAPLYFLLNKPKACVVTTQDPQGRPTVMDLMGRYRHKVYPVGRLDYHSEGLLLLTNDGEFANHVLSARNKVAKTYRVKIDGHPTQADLEKFRSGLRLDGRPTARAKIRQTRPGPNPWFEVELIEGRKNQIRRMFRKLGFHVEKLKRVQVGPVKLRGLPSGKFRELTAAEISQLLGERKPPARETRPRGQRAQTRSRNGRRRGATVR